MIEKKGIYWGRINHLEVMSVTHLWNNASKWKDNNIYSYKGPTWQVKETGNMSIEVTVEKKKKKKKKHSKPK